MIHVCTGRGDTGTQWTGPLLDPPLLFTNEQLQYGRQVSNGWYSGLLRISLRLYSLGFMFRSYIGVMK